LEQARRERLEATLKAKLAVSHAEESDSEEIRVLDRGKNLHKIRVSILPNKVPKTSTFIGHANCKEYRPRRSQLVREAMRSKRRKFTGKGPNVLVLDGTIDYYPYQLSTILRGPLRSETIPVPDRLTLLPAETARGKKPQFKIHPELAAVVFKLHTTPIPT